MYALVCSTSKEAAVVDPSFESPSEFEALVDHLEREDATLKHVLLTHGHADHVLGVVETMNTWPQASLRLHPLEDENYRRSREMGLDFGIRLPNKPLPTPTHALRDGEVLTVGDSIELTVVHTPGHAPGHVAFVDRRSVQSLRNEDIIDDNDDNKNNEGSVLVSGDLLFHGSVGRTDFPNSSIDDLYAR